MASPVRDTASKDTLLYQPFMAMKDSFIGVVKQ